MLEKSYVPWSLENVEQKEDKKCWNPNLDHCHTLNVFNILYCMEAPPATVPHQGKVATHCRCYPR